VGNWMPVGLAFADMADNPPNMYLVGQTES
jgi:hypothetical protein